MDINNIPDMVISDICSYLSFEDIQTLMKTNRRNCNAIKLYNWDKIRLKYLFLDTQYQMSATGYDLSGIRYKVANFTVHKGEEDAKIKQVLDQVYSVDKLDIARKVFSMELFDKLMTAKIKVKVFNLYSDRIDISPNDLVKFCHKFPQVNVETTCKTDADPSIWNDEVLISVLPSTICKPKSGDIIGGVNSPMLITDRTLEAVTKCMPNEFSLYRIYTCITVEGIVKAIQTVLDKKKTDVRWQLGCLNSNQTTLADRYLQKEAGRRFYFTRTSGSYCKHEYKVLDSTNDSWFMRFDTSKQ